MSNKRILIFSLALRRRNFSKYRAIVLTAQGSNKIIIPLIQQVRSYLEQVGGVVNGSIKEERAL